MPTDSTRSLISRLREFAAERIGWEAWELLIREKGISIDRPRGSRHPDHPDIIYPIDYGYVNETLGTDGHELDVFAGSAENGLLGAIVTRDHRKGDTEFKLIVDCTPEEIYLVNGFINFDTRLMEGILVLRRPMADLWRDVDIS